MADLDRLLSNRRRDAMHDADALDAADFWSDALDVIAPLAGAAAGGAVGGPAGAAAGGAAASYAANQATAGGNGYAPGVAVDWQKAIQQYQQGQGGGYVPPKPPPPPPPKGPHIGLGGIGTGSHISVGGFTVVTVGSVSGRNLSQDALRVADYLLTTPAARSLRIVTIAQQLGIATNTASKGAVALAVALSTQRPGQGVPVLFYGGQCPGNATFDDLQAKYGKPSGAVGASWGTPLGGRLAGLAVGALDSRGPSTSRAPSASRGSTPRWRVLSPDMIARALRFLPNARAMMGDRHFARISLLGALLGGQEAAAAAAHVQTMIASGRTTQVRSTFAGNAMGLFDAGEDNTDTNAVPGALGSDGHWHYQLQAGDYGTKIPPYYGQPASAVQELIAVNPGRNWNTMPAGTDLVIPDGWIDAALLNPPATPPPPPPALPPAPPIFVQPPGQPPVLSPPMSLPPPVPVAWQPPPPQPVVPGAQPPIPINVNAAGFQQALLIVAAWGKATGRIMPPGFGDTTGDLAATGPNPRNQNAFLSFQQFWNREGKGSGLNETGSLDDATYQALLSWNATAQGKEAKAAGGSGIMLLLAAAGAVATFIK